MSYQKIPWSLEWVQNEPMCCLLARELTRRDHRSVLVVLLPSRPWPITPCFNSELIVSSCCLISVCNPADRNFIVCGTMAGTLRAHNLLYLDLVKKKNLMGKLIPFGGCAKDQDAYLFLHWTQWKISILRKLAFHCWHFTEGYGLTQGVYFLGYPSHPGSAVDLLSQNPWGWGLDM